jgi:MFS family permease
MGRSLRRVLGSWLLFSSAQWMFMIAVGVASYAHSGAAGVGAVSVARLVPALLVAPLAGNLVDRYDRARVVTLSCASATVALGIGATVVADDRPLWAMVAVTAAASALGAPPRPALEALLPALARTPAELVRATAYWSGADSAGFLAGAGAGGLLIAWVGTGSVVAIAAALAGSTTILAVGLPAITASEADEDVDDTGLLAGVRAVLSTPGLRAPYVLFVGLLLLEGTTDVQLVALAIDDLGLGDGGPGLLYLVWGVGGLLGSVALLRIVRRTGYGRALLVGSVVFGLLLTVSGLGGVAVVIAVMVPVGLGFALVEGAVMGVIPRLADDAVIGRVYGVSEFLYAGVTALGAALAPLLIGWLGVGDSLVAVGSCYALCALATWRWCAQPDRGQQTASRVRDLLHDVPFLTPLPLPHLERLVRAARPVTVAPNEMIIATGEVGDEFYVVEDGTLDVIEYGRRLGPGDGFGEIALLRDVPRTATIRARTSSRLWVVDRAPFLAALGASDDAVQTAAGVIDEHLARPPTSGPGDAEPAES